MRSLLKTSLVSFVLLAALAGSSVARDAAFMDPGASGNSGDDAVRVEPKGNIDAGETTLGVAKRITLFFVNQTGFPVQVEKIAVNSDGNVAAELSNDDCTKQGTLGAQSRCSVEVAVTPTSPGAWSVDVLMTHNGSGRIARGQLSGKTTGSTDEKKENGLSFSGKEATPVNFGEVTPDSGKAVRSALMVNDSTDPITIYSIDVVEADNGLKRLEKGCAVDMQLKPGESCPVTLVWAPNDSGQVSTDLIIRHSGRLGFSVIPIRGKTVGGSASSRSTKSSQIAHEDVSYAPKVSAHELSLVPPPPSAPELDRSAERAPSPMPMASGDEGLHLIGTVGNRGIFLKPDGTTTIAGVNEMIDSDNGDKGVLVIAISAKSAEIVAGDKKKTLHLQASSDLVARASSSSRSRQATSAAAAAAAAAATTVPSSSTSTTPTPATVPTTPAPATTSSGTGGTGGAK
jgi:hypothetical protein